MTQRKDGGRIVPFPSSAAYVRRKALENRREGRLVEAAELFRRGAELEEGTQCLLDLAHVLAQMGCYQQANQALHRVLIRQPMEAEAYYLLALNHLAMGAYEEAADRAANCLNLAPEGPWAEELQEMLEQMAQPEGTPVSSRQGILARRSMIFQGLGQFEKARKAFKRALRASRKNPAMHCGMGFLLLEQGDTRGAIRHAQAALKKDPGSCHAHCLRAMALYAQGSAPLAERLMEAQSLNCTRDDEILLLCSTARRMGREAQALHFLKRQLRRRPYAIPLLEEAALSHWRLMQIPQAIKLWKRILRIDPCNDSAKVCLKMALKGAHEPPEQAGLIPQGERYARLQILTQALSQGPETFANTGESIPRWEDMITWAFTLPHCGLHQPLLKALETWPQAKMSAFLRPLLLDGRVSPQVRSQIIYHLILAGEKGPFLMLYGPHITQADRQQEAEKQLGGWRRFLKLFLAECRDIPDAAAATAFAARCWEALTSLQKLEALGDRVYAWVMAVKLLALEQQGLIELESKLAWRMPISVRRVERLMDLIEKQLALEGDTNE